MLIISARDNENNRWKRNAQKQQQQQQQQNNKERKEQGRIEAIVNEWELNDFVVHLT